MQQQPPKQAHGPRVNRIVDVMSHTNRYACRGVERLSKDAGIPRTSLRRLINNEASPFFDLVASVATALERDLGRKLDPRELYSENGTFPTPFTCDLCGCQGCLPDAATDEFGDLKQTYIGITPGQWVTSRFPRGFASQKGIEHGN